MSTLPHRFSEKSFRRYEPIIATVVTEFPNVTVVRPSDLELSAETVRGRLRDAITSLKVHQWPTKIDMNRFMTIVYDNIVVSLRPDGMVAVGNKDTVKNEVVEPFNAIDPTNILDCTEGLININTLCFLAHNRALSKRLKIKLSPEDAKNWMESYDIVLTEQPGNTYLLS